jgi:phage terminase large subunit-like protein
MPTVGPGNAARRVQDSTPGPWKSWKGLSRAGRCIRFIETYCRPPKGEGHGLPMKLMGWEKREIRKALAKGIEAYVLTVARGNGKTTLLAGIATWALYDDDDTGSPSVPIVAVTIQQALRGVYGIVEAMILAEPELSRRAIVFTGVTTPRIFVAFNRGLCYPVAKELSGLQGMDPSLAVLDEIGFLPMDTWNAVSLASGKRPHSTMIGIGTLGPWHDERSALWILRKLVLAGRTLSGFAYTEFSARTGCRLDDQREWRRANPSLGKNLRLGALRTALGITPEAEFQIGRASCRERV